MIRLQKYIAEQGLASRRAAESLISQGLVQVNGRVVTEMGLKVDPRKDRVQVRGEMLGKKQRLRYILLNKPAGYICSVRDERGRRTVMDLLPQVQERVYPVGRLDYNTSGLLLLTNDGELTQQLLHPSHEVEKTYLAEVEGFLPRTALEKLCRGLQLSDGITAPAKARILRRKEDSSLVEICIHEGRNRQVRRMMEAIGHPVRHLKRIGEAFLDLQGLAAGEWRELRPDEVEKLKKL
ncbi:MAG: pseudouridine synthase [Bacillota bacterium]|nr:pseudouridine synthase [Bacillota bacterium]